MNLELYEKRTKEWSLGNPWDFTDYDKELSENQIPDLPYHKCETNKILKCCRCGKKVKRASNRSKSVCFNCKKLIQLKAMKAYLKRQRK